MKAVIEKNIIITTIFVLTGFSSVSQLPVKNIELGIGLGAYVYQGDLSPSDIGSFKTIKPGIHLFGTKIIGTHLSYRLNITIAGLKGDESKYSNPEYHQQRNFKFKTPLFELSALGVWDIRGNNYTRGKRVFSPYIFGGIGLSYLDIRRDWSGMNTEVFPTGSDVQVGLNIDINEKPPTILPLVPVGAGFRYEISDRYAITTESTVRFVFTDYLDGFSHAVNPKLDDHYYSQTIGLVYKLGKKNSLDCPKIKY